MTEKEKAKAIVDSFRDLVWNRTDEGGGGYRYSAQERFKNQIKCALIVVDEILRILFQHHEIDYWKAVRQEIENMKLS